MNDLTLSERETHLNLVADNRGEWLAYTDDPVMIRRLDKIATGTPHGDGWTYVLEKSQVSLRSKRPKRILTDDERADLATRLKRGRAAKRE